jgi:hypothetical protein
MRTGKARGWFVLVVMAGACGGESTGASDAEAGARLSVFVPSQDVTLAQQLFSGMTARERLVIRDGAEWPATWSRMHAGQNPQPALVQPDFNSEMALIAAMGEKPSGGFDIVIDSVVAHEKGAIVYVTERTPGPSCMTTGALSQPVHAVRAPKTEGAVWWRERSVVDNC